MKLLICVEDNGGTMFNGRRLSMDLTVREKILEASRGRRLLMSHYSRKQFDGMETGSVTEILADDDFLSKAQPGDACFLEGQDPAAVFGDVTELVLFRWNRRYPADQYFDKGLLKGLSLKRTAEFPGSSHETITMEVYGR